MGRQYEGTKLKFKKVRCKRTGKTKKSTNIYFIYRDPRTWKRVYESTGTAHREEAEEYRQQRLSELRAGETGQPLPHHKVALAQLLEDYARYKSDEPSFDRLSYSIESILTFWGEEPVSAVNIESTKLYHKKRNEQGRSNWTVRRELGDLRAAINHAHSMNRIPAFTFPILPPKGKNRIRFLLRDEVAAMLRSARVEYRSKFTLSLFIILAYYCGARKTAIMDLTWDRVDFAQNRIDFGASNGNKRRQNIPMPPYVRRILYARWRRYGNEAEYVFHQKENPTRRVKHIDKGFRAAVSRTGLEGVTPHTFRHTRVSELVQDRKSIQAISSYMSMSPQIILDVYSHAADAEVEDIANTIGRSRKVRKINETARKTAENQGNVRKTKYSKTKEIQ